ncbi:hypothetical protein MPH_00247, partial [Macrophomina phaseolina MS6]
FLALLLYEIFSFYFILDLYFSSIEKSF